MIRFQIGAALMVAAMIVAGWLYVANLRSRLDAQTRRADAAEARAEVVAQQAVLNGATADIGARQATATQQIIQTAEEAKHDVQASTDLESALDLYSAGVVRLREQGAAGSNASPDSPG